MATTGQVAPEGVYDSARRRTLLIDELRELFAYRDLLEQLVARNIKTRYKRSILGIAWTMLNPLLSMAVLWLVFSNIFVSSIQSYPVYILSGLLVWTFFSQTTVSIMGELLWGGSLMNRIYIPRSVFAIAALGTGLVNLLLALVPLTLVMLISGTPLTPALLFLPIAILLLALFSLGVGLWLSTLALQFADVIDMYQIFLTAWMYLTPIIYPLAVIPESYRWLFQFNPMYHLLEVFRLPIEQGRLPSPETTLIASLLAVGVFLGGSWFFTRKADEIAYRV